MPDIGNTVAGASIRNINGLMRGSVYTMTEDGTIQSVTAYIDDDATGDSFRAAIYNANTLTSVSLIDQSSIRTDISTAGWYTFTGFTGASITSGTAIFIGVGSNSAAGADVYHDTGTGYNLTITDINSLPSSGVNIGATVDARAISTYLTYTTAAGVTKTPSTAVLTMGGQIPLTNAYTYVAIQDTLINESGQVVANAANIRLLVWYNGQAIGAPDYSVNGQTSNASGSISWSVAPGSLANGQAIFYVAQDSISYSNYTCGRVVPTYG